MPINKLPIKFSQTLAIQCLADSTTDTTIDLTQDEVEIIDLTTDDTCDQFNPDIMSPSWIRPVSPSQLNWDQVDDEFEFGDPTSPSWCPPRMSPSTPADSTPSTITFSPIEGVDEESDSDETITIRINYEPTSPFFCGRQYSWESEDEDGEQLPPTPSWSRPTSPANFESATKRKLSEDEEDDEYFHHMMSPSWEYDIAKPISPIKKQKFARMSTAKKPRIIC